METTVRVCGRLEVRLDGRRIALPGRQGRAVFAYLLLHRSRPVTRDELRELLWPAEAPADPAESLNALLSRVRRALGPDVVEGRRELRLALPAGAWIDLEAARDALASAEAARDDRSAYDAAEQAHEIAACGLLPGDEGRWLDEPRRELEQLRLDALELLAGAGVRLALPAAERWARALVREAPLRESGHQRLMEALAARGGLPEALRAYEDLRVLLRDELGTAPSAATQALHQRLLAGDVPAPGPPPEERKLVAVLACDLPVTDPEDEGDARARLAAVVTRFGGITAGTALGLFGAQVTREDDAERAVRAALAACHEGAAARVGVARGEALVRGVPPAAVGPVVGAALKQLAAAPDGRVAADPATVQATRAAIAYDVRAGVNLAAARPVPARAGRSARLIGRARELEALESLYRTAVEQRRPRLVVVAGEAGIGKTRLTEALLARAEASGATILRGRCPAFGEGVAYWALREVVWDAAGVTLDDDARAAGAKLAALAAALGLPGASVAALAGTPADADELAFAWPGFLSALATRSPVLVAIEDLHWAGAPLLAFLERTVARAEGALLLIATTRPELAGGTSRIALEALAPPDARALVAELLPSAGEDLRRRVVDAAEGNPFFAEEIALDLDRHGGTLPDTVRALLAARIDALPAAEKAVLQHAAVVGRRFWAPALEPNRTGRALPDLLRALEDRGLVVTRPGSSLPGTRELWFAHGLTREVAYRSIPRGLRARTHADVAAWLERLAGDRRDEFVGFVAHHYEAAAAPAEAALAWPDDERARERVRAAAVAALLDAGAAAREGLLAGDGVRFAERALALAVSDQERLAALELRARSFHAAVLGPEALIAYQEAIALAGTLGDAAGAARLRAHAALLCMRYPGSFGDEDWRPIALDLVTSGLQAAGDDDGFEVGALLAARAWFSRSLDPALCDWDTARGDMERALAIGERTGSELLQTHALEGLTWIVLEDGLCEAEALGARLQRGARRLSNRVEANESLCVAAACFARAGRYEQARRAADDAVRQAAALSPHRRLHAAAAAAYALAPPGALDELLAVTADVVAHARGEGERICANGIVALAARALALYEAGAELAETLALLDELAESATWATLRTYGHPTAELLRPVVGPAATRRWIALTQRRGDAFSTIACLRAELPVAAAAGDPAELREVIAAAREVADRACAPALAAIADWAEAVAPARAGDAEALARALAAANALRAQGEHYTAGRLLAELLPAGPDAAATAAELRALGANASADLLA